ncbi:MAG: extracellular solute-binding protein [Firmicutes bacterium]|nr:extracellular solute-binding protein [Bacillota bacterium]
MTMKALRVKSMVIVLIMAALVLFGFPVRGEKSHEKNLVIYTPNGGELTGPVLKAFKARYPDIDVSLITGGTAVLMSRIRAEKDRPLGDVMWGGGTELFDANDALFEPYKSPEDPAFAVKDPQSRWHAYSVLPKVIMVNTVLVKPSEYPATMKDLLNPRWGEAGGVALSNPHYSGTGYAIVTALVTKYGWDFMQELLVNAKVTESSDAMFKMVREGEAPIGFINEDLGAKWLAEGAPVKLIYPKDGIPSEVDAVGIIKGAKDPKAAALFLDFVESKEMHELMRNVLMRRSARADVAPPASLAPTSELDIIMRDARWISEQQDKILKDFDIRLAKVPGILRDRLKKK